MSSLSPEELSRLLRDHSDALVLFARQWCRAAEDVVQDALIELSAVRVRPDNVRAWLYRVVRNKALNAARREARRRRHEAAVAGRHAEWFESRGQLESEIEEMTAALSSLPAEERELIVSRLWGGLTFREIGEVTRTSTATAYRNYQAAIESLRHELQTRKRVEA